MRVLCIRTRMIGGGNSYDVYVPLAEVPLYAVEYGRHQIIRDGKHYMEFDLATVSAEHCAMPQGWDKYTDWKAHQERASRKAAAALREVFPEFTRDEVPLLWIDGGHPSAAVETVIR